MYIYFTMSHATLQGMKIGVFDSGIGGKYIADALTREFPNSIVMFVNDQANVPYGDHTPQAIAALTARAIQPLIYAGCEIIVIACNTATTNAIASLRRAYPKLFFVGLEPMIKPAVALTKTNIIAVCATPATLKSHTYALLKERWATKCTVLEPDCGLWATAIEQGQAGTLKIEHLVASLANKRCDTIVLGCTHYHWLKERFVAADASMTILEPTDAIARRVRTLMADYSTFTAAIN
jgi:glutamate racemase